MIYQKDSFADDYDDHFYDDFFDVETEVPAGTSVIPFSCVFGGKYSNLGNNNICSDICAVIAAASPHNVEVTEIAYTFNAVPSDGRNAVEVLVPPGKASDYTDEYSLPSFRVEYPEMYYDVI